MKRDWNKPKVDIQSIVIVRANSKGFTATMRFTNPKYDKIYSHANKYFLYELVERYVEGVIR